MLVPKNLLEECAKRFNSIPGLQNSLKSTIQSQDKLVVAASPKATVGNEPTNASTTLADRKEMLKAVGKEPVDFAFERVIGKNDSVYSNFVELIGSAKRKVGRIVIKNGSSNIGFATGFMVSRRLLLTNWHVFNQQTDVGNSEVQFFYEYDIQGNPLQPIVFALKAEDFFYASEELDYCLVTVNDIDISGKVNLSSIGYLFLDPAMGKLGNENEESLNIIHHPNGDYKQLSIRENLFIKLTNNTIWYKTDTAPGSSGSPVLNDQWQTVALHHMGVAKQNDAGQYLDKDGNVIPMLNDNVDTSKIVWIANEGIRISVILNDLFSRFPDSPIINELKSPQKNIDMKTVDPSTAMPTSNIEKNVAPMETTLQNLVNISFPPSLIEANGIININIDTRANRNVKEKPDVTKPSTLANTDEAFLEAQKIAKEQSMDFTACAGYLPNFLGVDKIVPFFAPTPQLNKFIARLTNSTSTELKYFYYSVLFHSVRMVPALSAINVDGDSTKRQDKAKRIDNWLRDNRIDMNIQLNDPFYAKSNFDRGHMSRREDADYGDTPEIAKMSADLTCMYTNACPQVPAINRSNKHGLWGILENIVLEKGAEKEPTQTDRISVFNGPIFLDNDPVFKGIQIPLNFFKLIVWPTDAGNLKATAFKLSQETLLGDITFEELGIDKNLQFKEFQISIQALGDATSLDFSSILAFDTFDVANPTSVIALTTKTDLINHIKFHNKS